MVRLNNLGTRVVVALFGIPLIIIVSVLGRWPFVIFTLAIALISFFEFSQMVINKRHYVNMLIGILSISAIVINTYEHYIGYHSLIVMIVSALLALELLRNKGSAISNLGSTLLGIFYIGFFSSSLIALRQLYEYSYFLYDQGGYLIISVFASIWLCDSAAYFIGSAVGSHKIFPRISPNKSWEGTITGFFFAIFGMIVSHFLSTSNAVVLGMIVGIFGQTGDFIESMFKRDTNVKDSSGLIPGHGGIFDRFDSLLFTVPAVYMYLRIIG